MEPAYPIKTKIAQIGQHLSKSAHEEGNRELPRLAVVGDFGIPLRYLRAQLQAERETDALAHARVFAAGRLKAGSCLLLSGPPGIGKTYAAAAIVNTAEFRSKFFFSFPALCTSFFSDRRFEWIEKAKTTTLVAFDDMGAEYRKDGGMIDALIDEILVHREANLKATIITTNVGEKIYSMYSDRIGDRLKGTWAVRVLLQGTSLRV